MPNMRAYRPVVLCILDGWGLRDGGADNAIARATTPFWDRVMARCPHARLQASSGDVGLPAGQMGNSEVGHMNIGAGRVVIQDLPRIDEAFAEGAVGRNPAFTGFVDKLRASGGTCHLMGLLSPGGVHSHQRQLAGLARLVAERGIAVAVHAFLDGRDTPPRSALNFLAAFEAAVADAPAVRIATVGGRYFAMDRDTRWDRTAKAYGAMVSAEGPRAESAEAAVHAAYERAENDEFVTPTVIGEYAGMADGDGVLMGNFRADRVRQILAALLDPAFAGFERPRGIAFAAALGLTEYSAELNAFLGVLFPQPELRDTLGEVVAKAGLAQLRIAETEKYAHVTFFLNGGKERRFPGEERILIPSPKVATYDLKPEMSAPEVTDRLVAAIAESRFDLIVVNYANGDMVGHTGVFEAAVAAVETVDRCLARLAEAVTAAGGALVITADHGNVEQMRDPVTGQPHTAHTTNPVPVIVVGVDGIAVHDGRLANLAPTVLGLMGLAVPAAMTGRSLVVAAPQAAAVGHASA